MFKTNFYSNLTTPTRQFMSCRFFPCSPICEHEVTTCVVYGWSGSSSIRANASLFVSIIEPRKNRYSRQDSSVGSGGKSLKSLGARISKIPRATRNQSSCMITFPKRSVFCFELHQNNIKPFPMSDHDIMGVFHFSSCLLFSEVSSSSHARCTSTPTVIVLDYLDILDLMFFLSRVRRVFMRRQVRITVWHLTGIPSIDVWICSSEHLSICLNRI